ncbi:class I SAM-dependent methyltransferase [Piscinibacter koreensis]|uniref:Class I SAM-dependent methyltransferase n=1 Tax=Piscinibacter koreensis TaxID=2742824 RepID=A0A7Y6NMJ7_9BURK|nr:class I SAM-dependent methyltransferase [Schlegelella koreensis]NUZ05956.1 class I SAM-dependent methyltransferase [Schlegelella koreensis]
MGAGAALHGVARRLPWPLPALLAWSACWAAFAALAACGAPAVLAFAAAALVGVAAAAQARSTARRALLAGGFPVSLAASGLAGTLAAWAWLLPLVALALVYPVTAWRDAPLFPTPGGALRGLGRRARLRPGAAVLDVGCGLGHGLVELAREYPHARLTGVEWSPLLALITRLRCRFAHVRRGDMWEGDWSGFDLVYAFQRPESAARLVAKASAELRPGAWLVSLEFELPAFTPAHAMTCADGRPLWLYRAPFEVTTPRG